MRATGSSQARANGKTALLDVAHSILSTKRFHQYPTFKILNFQVELSKSDIPPSMSLALSSNFSTTAPLLRIPPLRKPDFVRCDEWYSCSEPMAGLRLDDCENAWMQLPRGTNPVIWYINGTEAIPPGPHNQLPRRVSHGKQ